MKNVRFVTSSACAFAVLAISPSLLAQESVEQRLKRLEQENKTLKQEVGALSSDVEKIDLGGFVPKIGQFSDVMGSSRGVGQGANKVYDIEQGISFGGYGEMVYKDRRKGEKDEADARRAILYVGYKFSDKWVFNSELEWEHGSTSKEGSASIEFAYLDYMHSNTVNFRAGLLLSPMGLINQLHEPTAFMASNRPEIEKRIIPSTWREMGAGLYGDVGDFAYQSYLMTALDGESFGAKGLRSGRQKGSESNSEDFSFITRVDYVGVNGLTLGASASYGNHGQDEVGSGLADPLDPTSGQTDVAIGNLETFMWEAHVDYRTGPWVFRALYAAADIDDTETFNNATQSNLAERMSGYYGEVGYDLMGMLSPGSEQQLRPFVRFEQINTQDQMAAGFTPQDKYDNEIVTYGLNYKPVPQVVIKADYADNENKPDVFTLVFGYVF
jgi:phosphate-selective porin